jgi:hypothetical protein
MLGTAGAGLAFPQQIRASQPSSRRPNLLFIFADEWHALFDNQADPYQMDPILHGKGKDRLMGEPHR